MDTGLLLLVIALALAFDYINGFHDTANAVATVISTRVLRPRTAIIMSASLNFLGALFSTHVATTIGRDLVAPGAISPTVLVGALVGAIAWNLVTWYYGIPSSSSHALVGGLVGSAVMANGLGVVKVAGLKKVALSFLLSPVMGVAAGLIIMVLVFLVLDRLHRSHGQALFGKLQVVSSALMSLSHGSNDSQKTMGIIAGALVSAGWLHEFHVPVWVKVAAATAMAMGTAAGGWRIIKTLGHKVIKLETPHGFAAETAAAAVIMGASSFGLPVSTTHVISSTILGVGLSQRLRAVRWSVARNIGMAMLLTLPISAVVGALTYATVSLVN